MSRLICLIVCVSLLSFLTGCNLQRIAVNQTADVLYVGAITTERESDVEFARAAIPASLKTLETFLYSSPENEKLLELLAKGYFSWAFAFLEGDLELAKANLVSEQALTELNRRCVMFYLRSRDYGFLLLNQADLQKAALAGDLKALKAQLNIMDEDNVRGLFWVAYGWASAINLSQDDPDMVSRLEVVQAIMARVQQLDDRYFDSGVHYFLGVLNASRPEMFGGNPVLAKKHFDIALERDGERNLMIPFLYGRFYATQTQDRALFVSMMEKVLSADLNTYPDRRLNNEIAQRRARFWLDHMDELIYE